MYVCICNAVTDAEIRTAVEEGADSIAKVSHQLGVGTCCGRCVPTACACIDEMLVRIQQENPVAA